MDNDETFQFNVMLNLAVCLGYSIISQIIAFLDSNKFLNTQSINIIILSVIAISALIWWQWRIHDARQSYYLLLSAVFGAYLGVLGNL